MPTLTDAETAYKVLEKVAYVISEAKGNVEGLLIAAGSEVSLAVKAQEALAEEGIHVSVVSMPSWDRFEKQTAEYKETCSS